jgi:NAD(P)H-dependent flavin oxidoreductase YrpB (nitropropane dioxygenase family)
MFGVTQVGNPQHADRAARRAIADVVALGHGGHVDELLARTGPSGTVLVTCGDLVWQSGDVDAPFVI